MASRPELFTVRHNAAERRYEVELDGQLCVAEYERQGETVYFTHTYVPPALRGRGIADALVRTALDEARRDNLRVVAACSFVARFIERHPAYADLLRKPGGAAP